MMQITKNPELEYSLSQHAVCHVVHSVCLDKKKEKRSDVYSEFLLLAAFEEQHFPEILDHRGLML